MKKNRAQRNNRSVTSQLGEGPLKFWMHNYKCQSPSKMWQSLVVTDQATFEIRRRKKEERNIRSTTEWSVQPVMAVPGGHSEQGIHKMHVEKCQKY